MILSKILYGLGQAVVNLLPIMFLLGVSNMMFRNIFIDKELDKTRTIRWKKGVFKIMWIGTGNIITSWLLPNLTINVSYGIFNHTLYELLRTGLILWVLFIATPIFGEFILYYLERITNASNHMVASFARMIIGMSQSSSDTPTEVEK